MHTEEEKLAAFKRAMDVMDRLRSDCPWNHAQTNETLRPLTIEEVYELSDAVLDGDSAALCKEVGDLALHVLFYAKVGEEKGEYDIADVLDGMCEKMIFRHPHVFGDGSGNKMTAEEVAKAWELRKKKEKAGKTILEGVPKSCEPVQKAYILQDKASAVGFDWDRPEDVWPKVDEEIAEAKEAVGLAIGSGACRLTEPENFGRCSCEPAAPEPGALGTCSCEPAAPEPLGTCSRTIASKEQNNFGRGSLEAIVPEQQKQQLGRSFAGGTPVVSREHAEEEFGDAMFALVNAARLYGVDPSVALQKACDKFQRRFTYMETQAAARSLDLGKMTLSEMDAIWDEGKAKGL